LGKVVATVTPEGAYHDGPLNLFEDGDTDKLIAILKNFPGEWPASLIVLDALADMMPGGDEDRAKDMNRVYGNVWRVVRETGASFLVIHHAGCEGSREKGSIAIRAKSDIVTLVKLDAVSMTLNLTWLKNRRGPKYANVGFGVASVALEGWNDKVLAATGGEVSATSPQAIQAQTKRDQDLDLMKVTLDLDLGGSATRAVWLAKMQERFGKANWSDDTFDRKRKILSEEGEITGGGVRGEPYTLTRNITRKPAPLKGGAGDAGNPCRPQTPATNPHAGNTSTEGDGQKGSQSVADDIAAALANEEARLQAMKDGEKNGES
jgi:hypothetical protein